jgi:hypothetical protein
MISIQKKSSRGFRGCQLLPPLSVPSTLHRILHHHFPLLVGRNTLQDKNSTNNTLNNNNRSSPARRRRTITTMVVGAVAVAATVAVAVVPPTQLPPRFPSPPTSTPGLVLFECGWEPGGWRTATSRESIGYAGRHPSLQSSTAGRATLHATPHASVHPPWSAVGSSTSGSGGMVPMDGIMGSIVTGQLHQHHGPSPSYGHRLGH